ncbi:MAG TPA: hypothetical protein VJH37_02950 [Candidatus Nanoarchaeia archaeon]|nr:hypothetical protein [Candidatus Nanoarchaeia archaeon]
MTRRKPRSDLLESIDCSLVEIESYHQADLTLEAWKDSSHLVKKLNEINPYTLPDPSERNGFFRLRKEAYRLHVDVLEARASFLHASPEHHNSSGRILALLQEAIVYARETRIPSLQRLRRKYADLCRRYSDPIVVIP